MSRLKVDDFGPFFEAVYGYPPFPWQERLMNLVAEKGWPEALDVPTGAGKTSAIDVAIFHLALEADRGVKRSAPVRVLFVVDRRLVVDDAFERARTLARALATRPAKAVERVAERLLLLAEDPGRPLAVARLRGGTPKEPDWVRTPAQPTVVVSTVDQVGSRLLFRGYGISASMRPVHAGLLGMDSLLLLDEAHLSQPFVQTARDVRRFQESPEGGNRAMAPFQVVTLSATQTDRAPRLVKSDDEKHKVLGPRLVRSKVAKLVEVPRETELVPALVEHAWLLSSCGTGSAVVVAVVVNRVRRARLVFEALKNKLGSEPEPPADVALLIGRSRPLDRDQVVDALRPRIAARRGSRDDGRPLLVVATQCIEAGADLDFDALVTELAPLDSLRQRFGRLNRMGREEQARAVVIATKDSLGARSKPDPVYGTASGATWTWLISKATKTRGSNVLTIDFGVRASAAWLPQGDELLACLAPRSEAPLLLPAFIERWNMTSPASAADPEVSLFLHGPETGPADVLVVWRADSPAAKSEAELDGWKEGLAICPPSALEAIALPVWEVSAWLSDTAHGDISDTEVAPEPADVDGGHAKPREVLRWCGADHEETSSVGASKIRPGDLVVVPAEWGGCDEWGWNPGSRKPVRDLGARAGAVQRRRELLRFSEGVFQDELRRDFEQEQPAILNDRVRLEATIGPRARTWAALVNSLRSANDEQIIDALQHVGDLPTEHERWLRGMASNRSVRVYRRSDGLPLAVEYRLTGALSGDVTSNGLATTEDEESSTARHAVELRPHLGAVAGMAERFAKQLGLPSSLVGDVRTAAYLHDVGKAHPAFKRWLYAGDELAAIAGPALAKSGRVSLGRAARQLAALPNGARHELASLAFAESHPSLAAANDGELVLWLIGTHHGWGRPFFPPVDWPGEDAAFQADLGERPTQSMPSQSLAELTAEWGVLCAGVTVRYGVWGLAWLEAIVRLADHRCSELEQDGER